MTAPSEVPGTRLMAIVRWILLAALAVVAATTWWKFGLGADTEEQGPDRFYCPMHPEIRSAAAGTCPICFMNLEPIPAERTGGSSSAPSAVPAPTSSAGAAPAGLAEVMLTLERRQSVGIATAVAQAREVGRELRLPAVVQAAESARSEVRVRGAGYVEAVAPIVTGVKVKAGQGLAWIYVPEVLAAQEELLAVQKLSTQPSRDESLHEDRGLLEAARRRLDLLGVSRGAVDKVLSDGKAQRGVAVSAPRGGVVTARNVSPGAYVTPDTLLFEITDLSEVWISATAGVEEASLPAGTTGRFVSRASATPRDVVFTLVEPSVAAATRTATLRFLAENSDSLLRPGEIGEVELTLPAEERVLVPRDAVVDLGSERYVFVEKAAGVFAPRVVRVGPLVDNDRVVLDGLRAGEVVVSRGAFLLDSESRLQSAVAPRDEATP